MKFTEHEDVVNIEIAGGEDLWYLSLLMKEGDVLISEVLRRVERKDDVLRNKKTERERIKVSIRIESIEFMELSSRLHILGQITGGPEDYIGEHQSINVEPGSVVSVVPQDKEKFIRNLEESSNLTNSTVLVLSTDDQNISLYGITESKNELVWRIQTGSGKMYDGKENSYRDEFLEKMEKYKQSEIYVIGPSIFRDSTSKLLSQNGFKSINSQVGGSEEDGIRELLQEGVVNLRRSAESKLVADFLKGVGSGISCYGRKDVEKSLEMRAVSTLLISDKFFRGSSAASFMEKCYQGGCKLFVVHSSWETGKIVDSYGGAVAVLRYRMDFSPARE
jgi:protein pelota